MSDFSDLGYLSRWSYARGADPIDVAVQGSTTLIEVWVNLQVREANGVPRLPAWQDISHVALARKIVGDLLDAGWSPPSDDVLAEAKRRVNPDNGGLLGRDAA